VPCVFCFWAVLAGCLGRAKLVLRIPRPGEKYMGRIRKGEGEQLTFLLNVSLARLEVYFNSRTYVVVY
jgi:hypothetical protein